MRQRVSCSWGIQTGPFAGYQATFVSQLLQLFHFHTGRPILITPEGQYWERGNFSTPKLDETEGFQCLGRSNWTICSPLRPSCPEIIPTFHLHTGEPILITLEGQWWEMGILTATEMDEIDYFQCLGRSNWTVWSPLSPCCPEIILPFSPLYWGVISYYPRGPIIGKGNFSSLKTEWDRGFSVPGAFKLDH